MLTPVRAVLDANLSFYEAFASQDVVAMARVWSTKHPVACVHRGWQAILGRRAVLSSWRAILEAPDCPPIRCEDVRAVLLDAAAYVTCVERLADALGVRQSVHRVAHVAQQARVDPPVGLLERHHRRRVR